MLLSLAQTLGTLPSGHVVELSPDRLAERLRKVVLSNAEADRRKGMRERIDLYRDRGAGVIARIFDETFSNHTVKAARKKFIKYAQSNNVTKRIIREISTVYAEPAKRYLADDAEQVTYRELIRSTALDRRLRFANRMTNLCNEVLLWPRVNSITGRPELRVLTPDNFFVVAHPLDSLVPAAFIIDQAPRSASKETDAHWLVVSDVEFFRLDRKGRIVEGSRVEHGLGRMPMMLVHRELPSEELLDGTSGADLISAHLAVAFLNTLLLKHQKSGTKQPYATGDMSTAATGQPLDEEVLQVFPEGVVLGSLDMVADPAHYVTAARAIIKQVAANYGIPESVYDLSYQASSGFEIELKRSGLREIRNDQILDWRSTEGDLAELMSDVLTAAGSDLAFDPTGWRINFGEMEPPSDPISRLTYWEKLRQMGLMSTVDMYLAMNPEATAEDAAAAIASNARLEAMRVQMFRALNASPDATIDDPGASPQDNGADNTGHGEPPIAGATAADQPEGIH